MDINLEKEQALYIRNKLLPVLETLTAALLEELPENPWDLVLRLGQDTLGRRGKPPLAHVKPEVLSEGSERNQPTDASRETSETSHLKGSHTGQGADQSSEIHCQPHVGVSQASDQESGWTADLEQTLSKTAGATLDNPVFPPMKTFDLFESLRSVHVLDDLTDNQVRLLMRYMNRLDYKGGERVFWQGDLGEKMYLVESGRFEVVKTRDNKQQRISLLGMGNSFGEMCLIFAGPRNATVVALDPENSVWEVEKDTYDMITTSDFH